MKFNRSYRSIIFISFIAFGILLTFSYAAFIYVTAQFNEKKMQEVKFNEDINFFVKNYENYQMPKITRFKFSSMYLGSDNLPEDIKPLIKDLKDGIYNRDEIGDGENSVAVKTLSNGEKLYILHHDREFDKVLKRKRHLFSILSYGFIVIILLSLIVGVFTSSRLINPIRKLYEMVINTDPENLPVDFSKGFRNDEVGALANALESSMERINSFIEREKQFTRDSSHELRTPVTIIKGAVELLQNIPDDNSQLRNKALKRIERSVKDMENTIETFLWLGRESIVEDNKIPCDIVKVIEDCVDENRYLLENKNVEVSIDSDETCVIEMIETVFKIAVTNLVRNAFFYTNEGRVNITVHKNCIEISDTGSGIDKDSINLITNPHIKGSESKGFGLGLSIVNQLCKRFSWTLDIQSFVSKGTTVKLMF